MNHAIASTLAVLFLYASAVHAHERTQIVAEKTDGLIIARVGDRQILRYRGEPGGMPAEYDKSYLRGGYIEAVFTPSGILVSDDYPPDHKHHHGIWSPWTKTKFEGRSPDFWNMGSKTGTVETVSFGETASRRGTAAFVAKHRMVDLTAKPEPKAAIDETWEVSVHAPGHHVGNQPANVFDLTITQTCASESPLILPEYRYGGLGFRGHHEWNGKANCRFLTSEGVTDRIKGDRTRAKWCHIGGDVAGKPAGIAILCHPDNFRFPQPVRLHPTEPFFCYAPPQLGEFKIEPGKPYVAKYRFVVSDGLADAKEIERMWGEYAREDEAQSK